MLGVLKKKCLPGWLAIGLQPNRVDLVHATRSGSGRPEIALCDSFQKEGSDAQTLARLKKSLHLDRYRCTTLLPSESYQLHQLDAPNVPSEEVKAAVRWRVKDIIDYPLEAATIDVLNIPPDMSSQGREHTLYAVTARNDSIASCLTPFREADIHVAALDILDLAQRNIAALLEEQSAGIAMLAFYEREAMLTFTWGGELFLSRRIEVTVKQLTGSNPEDVEQHVERIALEIQRSLDHFEYQFRYVPISKLVLGPLRKDDTLKESLASHLSTEVETVNLATIIDFPSIPELKQPDTQAQYFQLVGAALRSLNRAAA